ncbi:hypothetical protein O0Q50_28600 [Priestia aryabhattai]|uniref:Uncharacterized protein n=1 Tax=Priestia aryabhattai TaxID=412384 RepID=A0AAX6NH35_PRIAR|nr:hypothetical protein [Priestia aryabhattai]MDU9695162.1 hypothetical protein [Priestia aryabhattai]
MFETYTELCNWLTSIPGGVHSANQLQTLLEPGKELGYIPFDTSFTSEPLNISFFLLDAQRFIKVSILLHDGDADKSYLTVSIRKNHDLVKKDISYSKLNYYTRAFNDLDVNLAFKDGHEISLSSTEFKRTPSNFKDFVNNLLKL